MPGGPLVMNARPQKNHIRRIHLRPDPVGTLHASTKAHIAAVSNNSSRQSVLTILAAKNGANDSDQTTVGSHGFDGTRRRPRANSSRPVPTNASAAGRRAAHSFSPSAAKLAASAQ